MNLYALFFPTLYLIVIIFGIVNYNKIKDVFFLKLFLFFLVYSFLTEITAFYIGIYKGINTFYIFNTWTIVSTYFYLYFFLNLVGNNFKRNFLKLLILIYSIFSIIDILFFADFIYKGLNNNTIIANIFIVISILIYFSELLQSSAILNIKHTIYFWIAIGVLLYNIGFLPIIVIAEYINYSGVFRYTIYVLNFITDSCFILGFVLSKKEYNKLTLTSLNN